MKKYIFLTSSVGNVGGAQMYLANKSKYLESKGWETIAYCANDHPIYINYSSNFKWEVIVEFKYSIKSVSSKIRRRVVNDIVSNISDDDEVIIECNNFITSFWGELIAKQINGKCMVFILQESIPSLTIKESDFFNFKLQRKELMNSSERSLRNIFKEYYKQEFSLHNYHLSPFCSNVVSNTAIELPESLIGADYNILSIGRLDKLYIKPMLFEIMKFVSTHENFKFNLIFIGNDASNTMPKFINDYFEQTSNVSLFLLGFLIPIPLDWINIADVSIASSNSVLVSADEGIPTIAIDSLDYDAIGIFGLTTNNTYLRSDEPRLTISDLLEDVLIRKKYQKGAKKNKAEDVLELNFKSHIDFLNISSKEKSYYDVNGIYTINEKLVSMLKRLIFPFYATMRNILNK